MRVAIAAVFLLLMLGVAHAAQEKIVYSMNVVAVYITIVFFIVLIVYFLTGKKAIKK